MMAEKNGSGWKTTLMTMFVPLLAVAYTWGTQGATIKDTKEDVAALKVDCSRMGKMETDIAVIRSKMESYDKNMKEMNETLKGVPDAWHLRAAERKAAAAVVDGGE